MQIAPQSVGMAPPKPSIVPGAAYAYDVEHRTGLVTATLKGQDIAGVSAMDVPMCPGGLAAAVSSVTGGDVVGFDMYGQLISETVGAAGTSAYTFARIMSGPADLLWANVFGLPYKWASGGTVNTYAAPSDTGDPRGTVAPASAGDDIVLDYVADTAELFGEPLAARFATSDAVALTTFAGTIDNTGAVAVTTTLIADDSATITLSFPDGGTVVAANGAGTVNYTLSPVWMSQYGKVITDVDTLVTGSTAHGSPIAVDLTGATTLGGGGGGGTPVTDPEITEPVSFSTHGAADAWLNVYTSKGYDRPDDWDASTLAVKLAIAKALYEHWVANH